MNSNEIEYYRVRKEFMRVRANALKRIKRSENAKFDNVLAMYELSVPTPNEDFQTMPALKQDRKLAELKEDLANLKQAMTSELSTLKGIKAEFTKRTGYEPIFTGPQFTTYTAQRRTAIGHALEKFNQNIYGIQQNLEVKKLMDSIDARTDLTDEAKEALKILIRQKLDGDKPDYDDAIPGMTIQEILEKYPHMWQRAKELEQQSIEALKNSIDAESLISDDAEVF